MNTLSTIIKNARIVDGTGRPSYFGDVGISADRIAVVGRAQGNGDTRIIEAGGKVLAPGFIDIHTHYDAQLCWDAVASPTPEFGVTSIVMGNCSLSMAPIKQEYRDLIARLFESIEDIPASVIRSEVPFNWMTFPEYLERLGQGLGINVGCLVGHTLLRYYVMGDAARERAATPVEIAKMCEVLTDAIRAGAMGLSLTYGHKDDAGNRLPTSYAEMGEWLALCHAMMAGGRGVIEVAPNFSSHEETIGLYDMLGYLSLETGVAASLDGIVYVPAHGDHWKRQLAKLEQWQQRGARLTAQVIVRPFDQTHNFSGNAITFGKTPHWSKIIMASVEEKTAAFRDPETRMALVKEAEDMLHHVLEHTTVAETHSQANKRYQGRLLSEVAAAMGKSSLADTLIDVALADDLLTTFATSGVTHADTDIVAELLHHPLTHVGAGDAGAHISQFAGAGDTCYMFEHYVRKTGKFSLEKAVQRLTSDLTRDWNIRDRGVIDVGRFADLVLFDPEVIARGDDVRLNDMPGGGSRVVRRPNGIEKVLVNGEVLVDRGEYTEARRGVVI